MKNILLTGATGFLGSHLTKKFVKEGYRVNILIRKTSDTSRITEIIDRVCIYYTEDKVENIFINKDIFDVIIHTACCYGRHGETFSQTVNTNLFFALDLLDLARKYNVGVFFNADTVLEKYSNEYSLSKKQFIEWGKMIAEKNGPQFINLKLGYIYGPGEAKNKLFTGWIVDSCKNNIENIPLTSGKQQLDFVYIDDVVNAYNLLLSKSYSTSFSEFEVGSGKAVSVKQFAETVHRLTGSSSHLQFGAIPSREKEMLFSVADITKLNDMGWSPEFDIERGIAKTLSIK